MASGDFSPELCEQLLSVPKTVASKINWKPDTSGIFKFQAQVLTADGKGLHLIGYWSSKTGITKWGFNLSYNGHCVRSYDMSSEHKNPGMAGRIKGPHKHKYLSSKIDRFAYKPDPPISENNANEALMDFLTEANIELPANYQNFMFPY
jgi:hypothetical protein